MEVLRHWLGCSVSCETAISLWREGNHCGSIEGIANLENADSRHLLMRYKRTGVLTDYKKHEGNPCMVIVPEGCKV